MHPSSTPESVSSTPESVDSSTDPSSGEPVIVGAIPARYGSTRLPGKVLREIAGLTMLEHVYNRASQAEGLAKVIVLTDDDRVASVVDGFGGTVEMTPVDCASGTDRIAYAAREWTATAIVNIQGDEPLIEPEAISRLASHLAERPAHGIVTLAAPAAAGDLADPNVVKVVVDRAGRALYFSRAPIPHSREGGPAPASRHIGIYGYQRETLLRLAALPSTPLERTESLEQLRALENGIPIQVLEVESAWPGVDTMEHLEEVERLLTG